MIDVDHRGPVSAKSYAGRQTVKAEPAEEPPQPAERARQEIDYGRRGKGYEVFSKLKKVVNSRVKTPTSIAQNRELGGKYSDGR